MRLLNTAIRQALGPTAYTLFAVFILAAWLPATTHAADPATATAAISSDAADEILEELKAIRQLLEKIERQGGTQRGKRTQPTSAAISTRGKPSLGKANAPLTVVEFTDYQCPYCLRFSKTTFPQLKQKYIDSGKVRWVALNLPLSFHKDARKAAQAAHCAGEQNKFWDMREKLFQHQQKLAVQHLTGYARQLSMNTGAFESCLQSDRYLAEIDKDTREANALRLTGTPSFIIGKTTPDIVSGRVVIGAQPLNVFEAAINRALQPGAAKQ